MRTPSDKDGEPDDPRYVRLRAERDELATRLGLLVELLRMLDRTVLAHAAVVGKSDPRVRELVENLDQQRLLDVDGALARTTTITTGKAPPLAGYCGLLLRWVSAILAGSQGTLLDVANRLRQALDPRGWPAPKGGFLKSEESVYWSFFKDHLRCELPLAFEDELKRLCGEKTFEAYAALRGPLVSPAPRSDEQPRA